MEWGLFLQLLYSHLMELGFDSTITVLSYSLHSDGKFVATLYP